MRNRSMNRQAPRPVRSRLSVEQLEARCLMDVALANGIWCVRGSDGPDWIVVDRDPADAATLRVVLNGQVVDQQPAAAVKQVYIDAGAGNDVVQVGPITTPTAVWGGS